MWIELHDGARDHPKILKVARDLGIPKVHVLGHVCSLWTWTLRMAPDGDLSSFDHEDIEIAAEWDGEPGKFITACIERGLLDRTEYGLAIHDWFDFAGSLKSAQRSREYRQRQRDLTHKLSEIHNNTSPSRDGDMTKPNSTVISRRPTDQTDQTDQTDVCQRDAPRESDRPHPDTGADAGQVRTPADAGSKPPILQLPLRGDKTFPITDQMVYAWQFSYPKLDVLGELKRACQWATDNPNRRKTEAGAKKFLGGWLARSHNNGGGGGSSSGSGPRVTVLDGMPDRYPWEPTEEEMFAEVNRICDEKGLP